MQKKKKEDKGNVASSSLCQKLFWFDGLVCQQWNKASTNRNLSFKQQDSKIIYPQVEVAGFMWAWKINYQWKGIYFFHSPYIYWQINVLYLPRGKNRSLKLFNQFTDLSQSFGGKKINVLSQIEPRKDKAGRSWFVYFSVKQLSGISFPHQNKTKQNTYFFF